MYKVTYYTTRGAIITKMFPTIDEATNFALEHFYGFDCISDKNGDVIFDKIDSRENGHFKFSRNYKPI